jgi:hypothetical protein
MYCITLAEWWFQAVVAPLLWPAMHLVVVDVGVMPAALPPGAGPSPPTLAAFILHHHSARGVVPVHTCVLLTASVHNYQRRECSASLQR